MNPITLHIGLTKTGSSSLQSALAAHRDLLKNAGLVYPLAGRSRHGHTAHHNLYYEISPHGRAHDKFIALRGTWKDALSEIDELPGGRGLISSEGFQYCLAEDVKRLIRLLAGRRIEVVVYLRRRDRWLESAWNQRARFGRVGLSFEMFFRDEGQILADYSLVLKPWIEALGDKCVDVRFYDSVSTEEGIVGDFIRAHGGGVSYAPSLFKYKDINTRAGVKHLLAVRLVLSACRKQIPDLLDLPKKSAMQISSFFKDRPDCVDYSAISFETASEIYRLYKDMDFALAQISSSFSAGMPFPMPDPAEFTNYVDFARLTNVILDEQEKGFVTKIEREIVRALRPAQGSQL